MDFIEELPLRITAKTAMDKNTNRPRETRRKDDREGQESDVACIVGTQMGNE